MLQPDNFIKFSEITNNDDSELKENFKLLKPKLIDFIITIYFDSTYEIDFLFSEIPSFVLFFNRETTRFSYYCKENLKNDQFLEYFFNYVLKLAVVYKKKMILKDEKANFIERTDLVILEKILFDEIVDKIEIFENKLTEEQYSWLVNFMKCIDNKYYSENEILVQKCIKKLNNDHESHDNEFKSGNFPWAWKYFLKGFFDSEILANVIFIKISINL